MSQHGGTVRKRNSVESSASSLGELTIVEGLLRTDFSQSSTAALPLAGFGIGFGRTGGGGAVDSNFFGVSGKFIVLHILPVSVSRANNPSYSAIE
jgi:hypothetical protein